jgi:hypothetical protein
MLPAPDICASQHHGIAIGPVAMLETIGPSRRRRPHPDARATRDAAMNADVLTSSAEERRDAAGLRHSGIPASRHC